MSASAEIKLCCKVVGFEDGFLFRCLGRIKSSTREAGDLELESNGKIIVLSRGMRIGEGFAEALKVWDT